jgi:probable HAF family extracellular repeat protein
MTRAFRVRHAQRVAVLVAILLASAHAADSATAAVIVSVGGLSTPDDSLIGGVSPDGTVVVGSSVADDRFRHAFAWAGGRMRPLGSSPGDDLGNALAASALGNVIVGTRSNNAFRWTESTGLQPLGSLVPSRATDISADGSVVVGVAGPQAWRWTAADGMVGLGSPPGQIVIDASVSDDGSTIAGATKGSTAPARAFRWTADGGMQELGGLPPAAQTSGAFDVSADGSVVVGTVGFSSTANAFRWTAEGGMAVLGNAVGGATAVTGDGSAVYGDLDGLHTFVWDAAHGMRELGPALAADYGLDLRGWKLQTVSGVSADGMTIVGDGVNPSGIDDAFVIMLPEPCGAAALLGAPLVLRRRRRRPSG